MNLYIRILFIHITNKNNINEVTFFKNKQITESKIDFSFYKGYISRKATMHLNIICR